MPLFVSVCVCLTQDETKEPLTQREQGTAESLHQEFEDMGLVCLPDDDLGLVPYSSWDTAPLSVPKGGDEQRKGGLANISNAPSNSEIL